MQINVGVAPSLTEGFQIGVSELVTAPQIVAILSPVILFKSLDE